jgi:predicted metal-dependent phosphoesterase TrpH
MHRLPFDKPGRFYRGGLHAHCTRSDGRRTAGEAVAAYRARGYDFLALTDHFLERYGYPVTDTRALRGADFTTLLGAELHAPRLENGESWHILAVGLPLDFAPPAPGETGPALAARAAAAGAFVAIAHPAWYGLTLADALAVEAAHAVEVINYGCALETQRGDSWQLLDQVLARGRRLTACATDDAHFVETIPPDWGGAWVEVRAEALEPAALLAALKAGHFYSSEGPRLDDIRIEGDEIVIACSPVASVHVTGLGSRATFRWGDGITRCALPLERFQGGYCRVTVVDAAGKRAWSNPIWLDE